MSVVSREFTYGIDEKLYTSETERDKLKNKFNTFMKKVDQDIKSTDAYLAELTAHKKAKTQTLQGLFAKKSLVLEEPKPSTDAEIELAIQKIIKKQQQRKLEDERFADAREKFNLIDNDETHQLLKKFDKLTSQNALVGLKVNKMRKLNDRGFRQLQAMHAADGDQLNNDGVATIVKKKPQTSQMPLYSMQQVSALAKSLGSGRQYELVESPKIEMMQKSTMHHLNKELHNMAGLPHIKGVASSNNEDVESTSDSSEKASQGFKIETDKVSQPICVQHFGPLELIAFALVNRQLKLYAIRQTVAKLVFEQKAQIRTD